MPGVPVDFRVPKGWPTPTDRWVQDNVLWQPPPHWAPRPGLDPAPNGWRYWSPNPGWPRATAPVYRSLRPWARASILLGAVCLIPVAVSFFAEIPLLVEAIGWVAVGLALAALAVFGILHRRITRRVMAEAAEIAEHTRRERMIREYQRYRWAVR